MANSTAIFKYTKTSKFLFGLGIFTSVYWFAGLLGVYSSDAGSAVFNLLWIFMVLLILILPLVSLIFVLKERASIKSLNLLTLIITLVTLVLLLTVS